MRNQINYMRPMTLDRDHDGNAHRIYDLSIADIEERKKKSVVYPTGFKAAQWLGMVENKISYWRVPGRRYFSDKHQKSFAIRMEKRA